MLMTICDRCGAQAPVDVPRIYNTELKPVIPEFRRSYLDVCQQCHDQFLEVVLNWWKARA